MITDSNIYTGGGSTIINIFTPSEGETEENDTVNDLIETCAESKDSLCRLYHMFKKRIRRSVQHNIGLSSLGRLRCRNVCKAYSGQELQS